MKKILSSRYNRKNFRDVTDVFFSLFIEEDLNAFEAKFSFQKVNFPRINSLVGREDFQCIVK